MADACYVTLFDCALRWSKSQEVLKVKFVLLLLSEKRTYACIQISAVITWQQRLENIL
jgi:hypothetical protein